MPDNATRFGAGIDHDNKKERNHENCYHVLHLDFQSLVEPRARNRNVKGAESKFATPDEDSDDDGAGRRAAPAVVDNYDGGTLANMD
jgi:hypothetical protein